MNIKHGALIPERSWRVVHTLWSLPVHTSAPPPHCTFVCVCVCLCACGKPTASRIHSHLLSSGGCIPPWSVFKSFWQLWDMIPLCKCFTFIFSLCFKEHVSHSYCCANQDNSTPKWFRCNSCIYSSASLPLCSFSFLAQIIYITIGALFFPCWGCPRIFKKSLPIKHIHYFEDKSCLEGRGAQFVSVTALGTDSSLPVTYLPLPLAFSVSKHEMFSWTHFWRKAWNGSWHGLHRRNTDVTDI